MDEMRYNMISAAHAQKMVLFFYEHNIRVRGEGLNLCVDVTPEQKHLINEFLQSLDAAETGCAWFKLPRDPEKQKKFWELATFYNLHSTRDRSGFFKKDSIKVEMFGHQAHLGGFGKDIKGL